MKKWEKKKTCTKVRERVKEREERLKRTREMEENWERDEEDKVMLKQRRKFEWR